MTSPQPVPRPTPPTGRPLDPGRPGARPVRVGDPAELVAAVPVLLGFHPGRSLVLLATGGRSGRRIELAVRVDLPPPGEVGDVARSAASSLLVARPAGAAVVVVGAGRGPAPPHRGLVAAASAALGERGVPVHTAVWAESAAAGARWSCYGDCGCRGLLPDPATTRLAAAAVAAGQVIYRSRAELRRLVEPAPAAVLRRREELLSGQAGTAVSDAVAAADPGLGYRLVDAAIRAAGRGELVLDDASVLAMAGALALPQVRDLALLRCLRPEPAGAEQLWAALVRETPDPEAAQPAALLAVSALLRGDGALANLALERAAAAWPGHRLSSLLRAAVQAGIHPAQVREWLTAQLEDGRVPRPRGPARGGPASRSGGPATGEPGRGGDRRRQR